MQQRLLNLPGAASLPGVALEILAGDNGADEDSNATKLKDLFHDD
jgi:hypothetical protein